MHLAGLSSKVKIEIEAFYVFKYDFLKNKILLKLYYLVLDVKLLLINMNHIEFFFF